MGQIRRQTILSSIVIYIGFAIGFINNYFYVKNGTFTTEQYGLTQLFIVLGVTFYSFATFGVLSYIYKFRPFYTGNLSKKENDQAAVSIVVVTIGFVLVAIAMVIFKPLFIRKYSGKSGLLIEYYYWILPYTLGLLYFTVLESFAWFEQKSILTNFLKETGIRMIQTIMIVCFIFRFFTFSTFIKIYSFTYLIIAVILFAHLVYTKKIHFNFKISRVTKKFYKKILWLMGLIYGSVVVNSLAQSVDSIVIGSLLGLTDVGIYTLASFIITTMQVPQRSIIAAVLPVLSNSWKAKDYIEIKRLYTRTSINLLLIALLIFFVIWLNINDMFQVLGVNKNYAAGKTVILILGISKIIDSGTGVNGQIIGTSNFWKFEVFTGILLLAISIPLNYILVKNYGINGSALSNLISFGIYNMIRLYFIWYKFKMQPFSLKTLYSLVLSFAIYLLTYYLFINLNGWTGIIVKSAIFSTLFIATIYVLKLTPDIGQFLEVAVNKFKKNDK